MRVDNCGMLRENRFPGLEVLIDRISHLFLSPSLCLSFSLPSSPLFFLSSAFARTVRLSLGVAPLLRFTFAMSLPVRSGRGKSVTQERSEAIGCDRYACEGEKQGPCAPGLHPRSALCELSHRAFARPCYETSIIRVK